MFTICLEENWHRANKVYQYIFGEEQKIPSGMYIFLVMQDTPVGVAVAKLTPEYNVEIKTVGIYEQLRGQGIGDFFMRSLFNSLTQRENDLIVDWVHPYFHKFGFVENEGKMYCEFKNLVFPHKCGH